MNYKLRILGLMPKCTIVLFITRVKGFIAQAQLSGSATAGNMALLFGVTRDSILQNFFAVFYNLVGAIYEIKLDPG
jgi:hypothetical protein